MTKYIRRAAALCAVLLLALLLNATRVQVFQAGAYDDNPANRRQTIARYGQPRGAILVGGGRSPAPGTAASSSATNGPTRTARCTRP